VAAPLTRLRTVMMNTFDNVARQAPTAEEVAWAPKPHTPKDIELMFQQSDCVGLAMSEYTSLPATGARSTSARVTGCGPTPADAARSCHLLKFPTNQPPNPSHQPNFNQYGRSCRGGWRPAFCGYACQHRRAYPTRPKAAQGHALPPKQTRGNSVNMNPKKACATATKPALTSKVPSWPTSRPDKRGARHQNPLLLPKSTTFTRLRPGTHLRRWLDHHGQRSRPGQGQPARRAGHRARTACATPPSRLPSSTS
jgi:hypothetical protein